MRNNYVLKLRLIFNNYDFFGLQKRKTTNEKKTRVIFKMGSV